MCRLAFLEILKKKNKKKSNDTSPTCIGSARTGALRLDDSKFLRNRVEIGTEKQKPMWEGDEARTTA